MLKTAKDWILDELGVEMPEGELTGKWFFENRLPMIVECSRCEMTMALPSALIDEDGRIYCSHCGF